LTDVSEVLTASIITAIVLMMEAASTSETSVNYQTTRRSIPEDLHTRRRENLKSQMNYEQFIINPFTKMPLKIQVKDKNISTKREEMHLYI
jgi:hypothetical protein